MKKFQKKTCMLFIGVVAAMALFSAATPAAGDGGGCPGIGGISSRLPDNDLQASATSDGTTVAYDFTSTDKSAVDGVPGLISYCVYPSQPPGNPTSASASAVGANGDSWDTAFKEIQGYFAFERPDGNPSNVPFDGSTVPIGTATWPANMAPDSDHQVILLHINDADACLALYGEGSSDTCFVYPGNKPANPGQCPASTVACKEVVIDEADTDDPLTVPAKTQLHIHYTYLIQNTLGGPDMIFKKPTSKTTDVNSGGGKDYFGCEQIPDNAGQPGTWGTYPNYQGTTLQLDLRQTSGMCNQSRFFLTNQSSSPFVLHSGDSVMFTVDMVTRTNKGKHQEYTSCGPHLLNSGFTVKWFQSDDNLLHSYSTNVNPIYVNVVGC
jgi:hypothetical protein